MRNGLIKRQTVCLRLLKHYLTPKTYRIRHFNKLRNEEDIRNMGHYPCLVTFREINRLTEKTVIVPPSASKCLKRVWFKVYVFHINKKYK